MLRAPAWVCASACTNSTAHVCLLCSPQRTWFLAALQAHWRLSSHQDVPTGPSLGRVPALSPACVLAECCQIIPHTWKAAWRRSHPPSSPHYCFSIPTPPPMPRRSERPEMAPSDTHRLLPLVPAPLSPTLTASGTHNGLHRPPNLSCISPTSKAGGKTTGHLNTVKTMAQWIFSEHSIVCSAWKEKKKDVRHYRK